MTWPPTAAQVAAFGGIDRVEGNQALTDATAGAVAYVERVRSDLATGLTDPDPEFDAPADVVLGTKMYAVNLYELRPGKAGEGERDTYPADQIERLLGVGVNRFDFGAPSEVVA